MTSPTKIAVYSISELKNTTDDALTNYLLSLSFTKSNRTLDTRLLLGYTAVAIAAVTFYFDWTLGWDRTKHWTALAVALYFALNGAFTWWIWQVERGTVFEGVMGGKDGAKIHISTTTPKHTPTYTLTARYTTARAPHAWHERRLSARFTRWFTSDGHLVARPLQQWLASEIPVIGQADPSNVVEEIGRGSGTKEDGGQQQGAVRLGQVLGQLGVGGGGRQGGGAKRRKG